MLSKRLKIGINCTFACSEISQHLYWFLTTNVQKKTEQTLDKLKKLWNDEVEPQQNVMKCSVQERGF